MKECVYDSNIFLLPDPDKRDAVCVTTNGIVRKDGRAVMGAGIAKYARDMFRGVDRRLGKNIKDFGNRAFALGWQPKITASQESSRYHEAKFMLLTFPTKHDWKEDSDPVLIQKSAKQVMGLADEHSLDTVYLPCPGCFNGHLDYEKDVRPVLVEELDDRFVVCVPYRIAEKMRCFG